MPGQERKSRRGIPQQATPPQEERRPSRVAEFVAMDTFWNEIVPACEPFYATKLEPLIPVTDQRLSRQHLSTLFGIEALRALAVATPKDKSVVSTDESGAVTRVTFEWDGTLHISKYIPGLGSARDTVDVFYKEEDTGVRLKVEMKEYTRNEKGKVEPVEKKVAFHFKTETEFRSDASYDFWGEDAEREINAKFIEDGETLWGEIGEVKK